MRIFSIALFLLLGLKVSAQENTFRAGLLLGANFSQIGGDKLGGYNKLGGVAGLHIATRVGKKNNLALEMLYSQRGSRSSRAESEEPVSIKTRYIEVPILFEFNDWLIKDAKGDYYRAQFIGGLSYGRLFSSEVSSFGFQQAVPQVKDDFTKNDISFIFGLNFMTTRHWGIGARYNRSINALYDPGQHNLEDNDPKVNYMFGYHLSAQLQYKF